MEQLSHAFERVEALAEFVTPCKLEFLQQLARQLALQLGFEEDKLRFMLVVFGAFPLAALFNQLPSSPLKHAFNIAVGITFAQFVIGAQWIHSFLSASLSYLLIRFGPPATAPYWVFGFNLGYMSLTHLYRIHVDYMGYTMDFSGPQMMLVIKLTSFAFNYYDGAVDKVIEKAKEPNAPRVYSSRKEFALTECPSLLEFYGYIYCFPSFFAGPAFEISEYLAVCNNTKFQCKGQLRHPPRAFAVFSKFVIGVVFLALYVLFSNSFPASILSNPALRERPLWYCLGQAWCFQMVLQFRFYFCWKLSESACVLCGYGFEGFNDDGTQRKWNGTSNVDILDFELTSSVRVASRAWNKCTQAWLERYVYLRTHNSLVATYFISALWHGFYPGYYFFFLSLPLATEVDRLRFKCRTAWLQGEHHVTKLLRHGFDFVSMLYYQALKTYLILPFHLMSLENSLTALRNLRFSGHIVMVVLFIAMTVAPKPRVVKDSKKTN